MVYIALPDEKQHRLPFYLAMEEYIAHVLPAGDYFFMWQVPPTVIFGRNQLVESEVNLSYCRNHGIEFYRRKSGGGCVYADFSNIMFSYITSESNVNFTFNRYMSMVEHVLHKLGIDAKTSGRNDILIGGKKVSGNAFYHLPGRSIVHGTMLFDTDLEHMSRSTTPSDEKLRSKGVCSVRQHVTNLKEYISLSIDEFKSFVRRNLCDQEFLLDDNAIEQIKKIEAGYYPDEFIFGHNPACSFVQRKRIEGVGEFETYVELKNGVIRKVNLMGDFFILSDLDSVLLDRLQGIEYTPDAVEKVLATLNIGDVIMNMTTEQFIEILF